MIKGSRETPTRSSPHPAGSPAATGYVPQRLPGRRWAERGGGQRRHLGRGEERRRGGKEGEPRGRRRWGPRGAARTPAALWGARGRRRGSGERGRPRGEGREGGKSEEGESGGEGREARRRPAKDVEGSEEETGPKAPTTVSPLAAHPRGPAWNIRRDGSGEAPHHGGGWASGVVPCSRIRRAPLWLSRAYVGRRRRARCPLRSLTAAVAAGVDPQRRAASEGGGASGGNARRRGRGLPHPGTAAPRAALAKEAERGRGVCGGRGWWGTGQNGGGAEGVGRWGVRCCCCGFFFGGLCRLSLCHLVLLWSLLHKPCCWSSCFLFFFSTFPQNKVEAGRGCEDTFHRAFWKTLGVVQAYRELSHSCVVMQN